MMLANWADEATVYQAGLHQSEDGKGHWGDVELVLSNPDYYVILNHPRPGVHYAPEKSIAMRMEPLVQRSHWPKWVEPSEREFLYVQKRNNLMWHLSKPYVYLNSTPIEKTKGDRLSTITSGNNFRYGHIKRLALNAFLDTHMDTFDLYGRDPFPYKSYRGPVATKDEGLFPYKYTIAAENSVEHDYFTEKLSDAILSECLTFYWGCPNVEDYIDPRAFIRVDAENPQSVLDTIKTSIANDEWSKRLPYIKAAKAKILNELQFMPTLDRILKTVDTTRDVAKADPRFPTIYCISLKSRQERRRRIHERFKYHGLKHNTIFLDATTTTDPLVDFYGSGGMPRGTHTYTTGFVLNYEAVYACMASHMRAVKAFVASGEKEAIIIEDDAMLRNSFREDYLRIMENVPDDVPLVQLAYIAIKWDMPWAGKDPSKHNLCRMKNDSVWGAVAYLIRRDYAIQCIRDFDKPLITFSHLPVTARTSELITRKDGGYIVYPILVIEDSVIGDAATQSSIRVDAGARSRFTSWGPHNFMAGEPNATLVL
ncbi:Hypothetical protein POVN_LOCUS194 [uncultured virus]|nr:Hypothetical protein POVN_LOCUS194 [uncultured virus]